MKRAGFTMIELIFVIVILGILAAVAIPKLAATRDDAKIAKGATELSTAVSDMSSYYTAQGHLGKISDMTNVLFDGTASANVDLNTSGNSVTYEGCITIKSTNSDTNATATGADGINVSYSSTGASKICRGIAKAAKNVTGWTSETADSNKSVTFGGSSVSW